MTDRESKFMGRKALGIYRWKCSCCMPKSGKGRKAFRRAVHKASRRIEREALRREVA